MKTNLELHQKAIALRRKGKSYREIEKELDIARSTLSSWLKQIPLSKKHKARLYTNRIKNMVRGPNSYHERRREEVTSIIKIAASEIKELSPAAYKLLGVGIYWGEGTKKGMAQITNSDPLLIAFMTKWFSAMFNVPVESFKAFLNIYPQQSEKEIKEFWSELTGIPISRFGRSFIKPRSKGYKKNTLYYGTIKITVPKSTDMKHKISGWLIGALKDQDSVKVLERWKSLKEVERPANLD